MKKKKGKKVATKRHVTLPDLLTIVAFAAISLMAGSVHASIQGAPFAPEVDTRFDNIEGNKIFNAKNGLHQKQIAVGTWDFAVQGGSSTVNAGQGAGVYNLGFSLPAKAVLVRSYAYVDTAVAGTGGATIAFQCGQGQSGNILAATSVVGTSAGSFIDGAQTGASTLFKELPANCAYQAVIGTKNLTAGKVTSYLEYVLHP